MKTKQPVLASELKFNGSNELAVGANGELNASSKRDLLVQQMQFMRAASEGKILASVDSKTDRELVQAMFNDSEAHRVLAEKVGEAVYMTANRQGFMRKYLARTDVTQGSIPRFQVRMQNVTAVMSTSPTQIAVQIVRDKWMTPPEIALVARPFIPLIELQQSNGDLLQEKSMEGVQGIMVGEDRMWYNQVQASVGIDNQLTVISGQLTPYALATVSTQVTRWGMKPAHILMASDLWQDVIGNSDFYTAIDPFARHELLLTGELGTLYGSTVTTDAYRHPEHKVLGQGEFYVVSDALTHGAYSDRGGITSEPTTLSNTGIPGRGIDMYESVAVSVANVRSVAKGVRVV